MLPRRVNQSTLFLPNGDHALSAKSPLHIHDVHPLLSGINVDLLVIAVPSLDPGAGELVEGLVEVRRRDTSESTESESRRHFLTVYRVSKTLFDAL